MRLSTDQIKAGILHADQDVRYIAVNYFSDSYSQDPTIVPLVIQAIEKYGFEDAFEDYDFLDELVQTEATTRWFADQIIKLGQPSNDEEAEPVHVYLSALVHAAPAQLHHCLDEKIVMYIELEEEDAIRERIELSSRSPEDLWEMFKVMCDDEVDDSDEGFLDHADRVVEAVARHCDVFTERILGMIYGEPLETGSMKEQFVIRLAGLMKMEAAIPLIMSTMLDEPEEIIEGECQEALVRIGTDAIVTEFVNNYEMSEWSEQQAMVETLQLLTTDKANQVCLDYIPFIEDPFTKCEYLRTLQYQFTTAGIEPAREFINSTPLDSEVAELQWALVTVCKLMGERFPEFESWSDAVKNRQEILDEWQAKNPFATFPYGEDDDGEDEEYGDDDNEEDEEDRSVRPIDNEPPKLKPFVRTEHVGRNDPCPCGSGKKFKKCCMGKE